MKSRILREWGRLTPNRPSSPFVASSRSDCGSESSIVETLKMHPLQEDYQRSKSNSSQPVASRYIEVFNFSYDLGALSGGSNCQPPQPLSLKKHYETYLSQSAALHRAVRPQMRKGGYYEGGDFVSDNLSGDFTKGVDGLRIITENHAPSCPKSRNQGASCCCSSDCSTRSGISVSPDVACLKSKSSLEKGHQQPKKKRQQLNSSKVNSGVSNATVKANSRRSVRKEAVTAESCSNFSPACVGVSVMNVPTLIEWGRVRLLILDAPSKSNLAAYLTVMRGYGVSDLVRTCVCTYDDAVVDAAGIQVHELLFQDGEAPPAHVIKEWLRLVHMAEAAGKAIAVHCVAGLGRAPVLAALSLIDRGMKPDDAVAFIRDRRKGSINRRQLEFLGGCRSQPHQRRCIRGCSIM